MQKIQRRRPVALLQQFFDQKLIAQQQVVNQMVVKRLINRQFLKRALKQRDRHIGAFTFQGLTAKINLLLQNAVEVSAQMRKIDRPAGLRNEMRS